MSISWTELLWLDAFYTALTALLLYRYKQRMLPVLVVVFCIPVAGFLLVLIYTACVRFFGLQRGSHPDWEEEEEPIVRQTKLARDVIPLRDAFLVEDTQRKRRYFTEAIKQSVLENQDILQLAMHDRDREVAYYAVSMVTTRIETMAHQIYEREQEMKGKAPEQISTAQLADYAGLLQSYLAQGSFIDPLTRETKQQAYIAVLRQLIGREPEQTEHYERLAAQLIEMQDYAAAEQVIQTFRQRLPQQEEPYLLACTLYVVSREPDKLQQTLRKLKALPITLSGRALQVIRYWDEGAKHA